MVNCKKDLLHKLYNISSTPTDKPYLEFERSLMKEPKLKEYLTNKRAERTECPEAKVSEETVNGVTYKVVEDGGRTKRYACNTTDAPAMIEVVANDRFGKKERIKCMPKDRVVDLKKLISAKFGTKHDRIRLQRGTNVLNDLVSLEDYEIKHGMGIEVFYK